MNPTQWFELIIAGPAQFLVTPWLKVLSRMLSGGGHQRVQQSHLSQDHVGLSLAAMQKLLKVTGEKAHTCERSQTSRGLCLSHEQTQHLSDKIAVTQLSKPVKKTGLGPVGDKVPRWCEQDST